MDAFADLLAQPRARGAFLLRVVMGGRWSVRIEDEAPLSVVPVLRGSAWFAPDNGSPLRLHAGDVLVVRSPTAYALSSSPALEHGARIGDGQACSGPDGRDLSDDLAYGVRTWGNDPAGEDEMLVGTYRSRSEVGRLMVTALPPWFVVPQQASGLVDLLAEETAQDRVGQSSVLDRLLDVLTVTTLRSWADGDGARRAGLLSADRDSAVRTAVTAVQRDPAAPWTTEDLARRAGLSRAALTRRFSAVLGVPPMTFVAQWRMATATELLEHSDATVATVARRVGYASPFSLSAAFKRHHGVSPTAFRAGARMPEWGP